mgnify:CR=1 FL=1|tara:strand:+ start:8732 stop:8920 length:189 start_codon:yes stop_codon:yes gene_type:complete
MQQIFIGSRALKAISDQAQRNKMNPNDMVRLDLMKRWSKKTKITQDQIDLAMKAFKSKQEKI